MRNKRILVVDDSRLYQRMLSDVINARDGLEVVGVASNGLVALSMMDQLQPDLVTLDILMPEMDGIQTLIELSKNWPKVICIMVSSVTSEGSEVALDAMALGAREYSSKPSSSGGVEHFRAELERDLLPKIEALCGLEELVLPERQPTQANVVADRTIRPMVAQPLSMAADVQKGIQLVAIGVSTGGPEALAHLLSQLPANFPVPVLIVQHMPAKFTAKLATRLNTGSALQIVETKMGDKLVPGTAYLAPGAFKKTAINESICFVLLLRCVF